MSTIEIERPRISDAPGAFSGQSNDSIERAFYLLFEAAFRGDDHRGAMDSAAGAQLIVAEAINELFARRQLSGSHAERDRGAEMKLRDLQQDFGNQSRFLREANVALAAIVENADHAAWLRTEGYDNVAAYFGLLDLIGELARHKFRDQSRADQSLDRGGAVSQEPT